MRDDGKVAAVAIALRKEWEWITPTTATALAHAAIDAMFDWRPMDTAPRDGTRILVFVPPQPGDDPFHAFTSWNRGWFSSWFDAERGDWMTGIREALDREADICEPIAWLPLPPAP